jgi:hypothetical protein
MDARILCVGAADHRTHIVEHYGVKEPCLYAEIFSNATFPDALPALDRELAREAKQRGCPCCGGVLDIADYPRKPRSVSRQVMA